MQKRYAVIEFGTRGLRLLVADASPAGISQVVYSTGGLGALGRSLDADGNLSLEAIASARAQAEAYVRSASEQGAEQISAFATQAVRAARNQADFLAALAPVCAVQVLDMEQEAVLSFLATVEAFHHTLRPGEMALVIDQGGGSLELACGGLHAEGTVVLRGYDSLQLGTVELTRQFAQADSLRDGYQRASQLVQRELSRHVAFPSLVGSPPAQVYGLGSAITTLAQRLPGGEPGRKSLKWLHGRFIPRETIGELIQRTDRELDTPKGKLGERVGVDGDLSTLLGGMLSYHYILEKYKARGITVNRHGLRYGVLLAQAGFPYQIELG